MKKHKEIIYNTYTEMDGDINPGVNHQLFEFNKKYETVERVVFKRVGDSFWDKIKYKIFGMTRPYPDSYFFTALNINNACKHITKKYNIFSLTVIEPEEIPHSA